MSQMSVDSKEFQARRTTRYMLLPLKQGDVSLEFPSDMSAADLEDVEKWFELLLRTMRRRFDPSIDLTCQKAEGPPTDARSPTPTDTTPVPTAI